jgi:uncharacterized membrane protein
MTNGLVIERNFLFFHGIINGIEDMLVLLIVSEDTMKSKVMMHLKCAVVLFLIGGLLYNLIEICWRGYTHWSMFIVGGTCFHLIGGVQMLLKKLSVVWRCAVCSVGITIVEFFSGCLFNLVLKLNVWDYSGFPLNIMGQVCILYTALWAFLSAIGQPLYRHCRSFLVNGRRKKAPSMIQVGK